MKIKIEVNDQKLKQLVAAYIKDQSGIDVDMTRLSIRMSTDTGCYGAVSATYEVER